MAIPEKLDKFWNAQLPIWVVAVVTIGASALAIVAGPPLLAVISQERAAQLVETHCAAPLSAQRLALERNYGLAIRDLNIDNATRLKALEEKNTASVIRIAALERQVCVLMAQRLGNDTDQCFAVGQ